MKTRAGKAFLPIPSRSWIYPTSANLKCRTRVNPSSDAGGGKPARLDAAAVRGEFSLHVRHLLQRTQIRRRAGDAARVSDADAGDAGGSRLAPGGGFLLPVARNAGEGRVQSGQVRPRVRARVQGAGKL